MGLELRAVTLTPHAACGHVNLYADVDLFEAIKNRDIGAVQVRVGDPNTCAVLDKDKGPISACTSTTHEHRRSSGVRPQRHHIALHSPGRPAVDRGNTLKKAWLACLARPSSMPMHPGQHRHACCLLVQHCASSHAAFCSEPAAPAAALTWAPLGAACMPACLVADSPGQGAGN